VRVLFFLLPVGETHSRGAGTGRCKPAATGRQMHRAVPAEPSHHACCCHVMLLLLLPLLTQALT
jgi:hypothetical protein